MISIFQVFPILLAMFGALLGLASKSWIVGVMGLGLGFFLGSVPGRLLNWRLERKISSQETDKLLKQLETELFLSYPIIRELVKRGHSPAEFKNHILRLLNSGSDTIRQFGWQNLKIWLPELALQISDFNPSASTEECKAKLAKISTENPT